MSYVPVPDVSALFVYLGDQTSWLEADISAALAAEITAQAAVCRVPVDEAGDIPADLAEALKRRVARSLQIRKSPLGMHTSPDGFATRISMQDPETRRLEAPYRKRVVG